MQYRCVTTSVTGFVQQIACSYLRHGYWYYVTGVIPKNKDPRAVDAKLIEKYGVAVSESTRGRRKRLGKANLQYLRYDHFFIILATDGRHVFKEEEGERIQDIRRVPVKFHGYSIGYRRGGRTMTGEVDSKWHAHVEIERKTYKELRDHFLNMATHRSVAKLVRAFYEISFEPYAPVRRQMLLLLRRVNQARKRAGFQPVPSEVLPLRRRVVKPFKTPDMLITVSGDPEPSGRGVVRWASPGNSALRAGPHCRGDD